MKESNNIELDDDFNCDGGISWGKSTHSSPIDMKKNDVSSEDEEEEIYYEPYVDCEREIPDGYEWESYSGTH